MATNYINKQPKPVESNIQAIINMVNIVPNFIQQWQETKRMYEMFGWSDELSDAQKIEEYKKISEQYKKYISNKKKIILDNLDQPQTLLNYIDKWMTTEPQQKTSGWSRWFITYVTLKDRWLWAMKKIIEDIIKSQNVKPEEE